MDCLCNLPPWVLMTLKGLAVILVIFPIAGACSLAERKVSAWIQGRPGPSRALPFWIAWVPVLAPILQKLGVFHLAADGGKLLFKEDPTPGHVNKFFFMLAPLVAVVPAFTTVVFVPFGAYLDSAKQMIPLALTHLDVGLLGVFAISSLGVYSLILAGWASNSKYPFLGSIRASAQLISYELSMTLSVLPIFLWINAPGTPGTLSLAKVVEFQSGAGLQASSLWYIFVFPVSAFIFLTALFAETNRQPFDMPESEADLVGGFHTEYGSFKWSLFFVAEYAHMTVGSGIFVLLFLGGWNPLPGLPLSTLVDLISGVFGAWAAHPIAVGALSIALFLAKVLFCIFFFMWVRWTLPRFRYDQVMKIGWQKLLPLSIANLLVYAIGIALIQK